MAFLFHQRNLSTVFTTLKSELIWAIFIPAPQNGGQILRANFTMFGLYIFASCLFITTFRVHIRITATLTGRTSTISEILPIYKTDCDVD
ncbi:hypothetical protein VCHA49P379_270009 [Vibrio chagasii]|nr:hypothetical protein VCHA29O37_60023 [Vibrio chagasii]CAH7169155.1 hypothetical protein VCHA49P379_270009 [Vibrio chagasii]CAH7454022.1 hypothetical protein VCHA53O474_70217 [Vibrio chagasii]